MKVDDNLWIDGDDLEAARPIKSRRPAAANPAGRLIGCPLVWFKLAVLAVRSKNELVVALYLYRLRAIRHSRTVCLSNVLLFDELGIDRHTKYRALQHLAGAGLIRIKRRGNQNLEVTFLGRAGL